jgi:hypothetical protein
MSAQSLMTWQAPGGFAGTGPALAVFGDGSVHVWSSIPGFDPKTPPTTAPSLTFTVTAAQLADLFARWAGTSLSGLPHPGGGAECYATVFVSPCPTCETSTLSYNQDTQVSPEMMNVWNWFDTNLFSNGTAAYPRSYCHF